MFTCPNNGFHNRLVHNAIQVQLQDNKPCKFDNNVIHDEAVIYCSIRHTEVSWKVFCLSRCTRVAGQISFENKFGQCRMPSSRIDKEAPVRKYVACSSLILKS